MLSYMFGFSLAVILPAACQIETVETCQNMLKFDLGGLITCN